TQAALLKERLGCAHVSTGDIFRKNLKEETPLGLLARSYMDKGALVPDEVVLKMVSGRLLEPDMEAGFLLDGFPRTIAQAEFLESFLAERGQALDAVILFDIGDEALVRRLSNRRTCRSCGAIFNLLTLDGDGHSCPACSGELYQRDDDEESVIRNRLKVFHDQTQPLIDWYGKKGLLSAVDASQAPEAAYGDITAILKRHGAP
ncbi:MAG: adenylate kinase, partial [Fretibacterium sp.]